MTLPTHARLHPWLPLLRDSTGSLRLRADRPSAPLPSDLGDAISAAARRIGERRDPPGDDAGVRALTHAGLVLDADELSRTAASGGDGVVRAHLSRDSRDPGRGARVRHRLEGCATVVGPASMTEPVSAALSGCGVPVGGPRRPPRGRHIDIRVGRPDPRQIHRWMYSGTVHLPVVPRAASIRIGPLVTPGQTACLQCLHLARTDLDPSWPHLSEQLCRATTPEPDPLLTGHAAALVARAIVPLLETGVTPLAGRYWVVDLDRTAHTEVAVERHPLCGCWWPLAPEVP